ncbi:MAG: hydroxymethylglutaryl-CoA reductase, degradative [Promethearchaeota archaeon]
MKNDFSRIPGFYKMKMKERQEYIARTLNLSENDLKLLQNLGYFSEERLNSIIENVIGSYQLPFALATNFKINDKDYLIPMVIEEPSVVAAASNAAKIARKRGGFFSDDINSLMIAQIQIVNVSNIKQAVKQIMSFKKDLLDLANETDSFLIKLGGGARDLRIRVLNSKRGKMIIVHLIVNVLDAMGANIVNTMAEAIAPRLEMITKGKIYLRIVSNLSIYRVAKSRAIFDKELLGGDDVVEGIMMAYEFAKIDPFRAATHNKGIMNGIIALTLATGNDTRAIEAGAHSYAALTGKYLPLTSFSVDEENNLIGKIEIPLTLGIIGGITRVHPIAKLAIKILGVQTSNELAQVAAAVGLAQNVAALRALVSEGIQKGHMKLHAKNIAIMAGVPDNLLDQVVFHMMKSNDINMENAKRILSRLKINQKT